eukprot:5667636-Alexandrium_andersonii.AAC.1
MHRSTCTDTRTRMHRHTCADKHAQTCLHVARSVAEPSTELVEPQGATDFEFNWLPRPGFVRSPSSRELQRAPAR